MGTAVTPADPWGGLSPFCRRLGELLATERGPGELAERIAGLLREQVPEAALSACRLPGDPPALTVLDPSGQPFVAAAVLVPVLEAADSPTSLSAATGMKFPGHSLLIEPIGPKAALALLVPEDVAAKSPQIRGLLACGAAMIAVQLDRAADQRASRELADFGELARPLCHSFNNFLNNLSLKVAVLEHQVPEACKASLAQVRQQTVGIADLIRKYQQYRKQEQPNRRLDLNQILHESVVQLGRDESGAGGPPALVLKLAEGLPSVAGQAADIKRCCVFLIANALRAAPKGTVAVHTESAPGIVRLR